MPVINFEKLDYDKDSLNAGFSLDDIQCVCSRLIIHRKKYWANPNLGSLLYTLRRSKDVPRTRVLAKQYAEQALRDLVPSRFQGITVTASSSERSRIELNIELVNLSGQRQQIIHFVRVGG